MDNPSKADQIMTQYSRRKCERIIEKVVAAVEDAAREYQTLDVLERMSIAASVAEAIAMQPICAMSNDPHQMRQVVADELKQLLAKGEEQGN